MGSITPVLRNEALCLTRAACTSVSASTCVWNRVGGVRGWNICVREVERKDSQDDTDPRHRMYLRTSMASALAKLQHDEMHTFMHTFMHGVTQRFTHRFMHMCAYLDCLGAGKAPARPADPLVLDARQRALGAPVPLVWQRLRGSRKAGRGRGGGGYREVWGERRPLVRYSHSVCRAV